MNTTILLLVIAIVALVAIGAWYSLQRQRTQALRDRFGPEYERAVEESGSERKAEHELEARARRVDALDIRPLDEAERARFTTAWRSVQSRFVDEPAQAVGEADRLVGEVMGARGYPVADFEQRAADVSASHPHVVDHYRAAHRIATTNWSGAPDTEALRQAMVHYRALFADLLDLPESAITGTTARTATSDVVTDAAPGPAAASGPSARPSTNDPTPATTVTGDPATTRRSR